MIARCEFHFHDRCDARALRPVVQPAVQLLDRIGRTAY
jgi:hypothetical protein